MPTAVFGSLLGYGEGEQLLLEPFEGDGEVEQRQLDAGLGRVVRVGQLRKLTVAVSHAVFAMHACS